MLSDEKPGLDKDEGEAPQRKSGEGSRRRKISDIDPTAYCTGLSV
jgi:hypothetical protein